MAAKKGNYQIPFDQKGDQMEYPETWRGEIDWRDNFEFEDGLTLIGYGRGRSSITFQFRRDKGGVVSMFVSDFYEAAHKMVRGRIKGRFTFVKKGQNYGCKMVEGE